MKLVLIATMLATPAMADPPQIVSTDVTQTGTTWTVDVTLRHPDTGWDHYADGWRIETPEGTILGTRELVHPHVNEQPFTRSLGGVAIPDNTNAVRIRARCLIDGWSDATAKLRLKP